MGLRFHQQHAHQHLKTPEYAFLLNPADRTTRIALHTQFVRSYSQEPLICIGAVKIQGNRAQISQGLEVHFHPQDAPAPPGCKIFVTSVERALDRLFRFIANGTLVGYQLAHHLRVLNRFVQPRLGIPLPNRTLELVRLYQARNAWHGLFRRRPDLDELSHRLQVPLPGPHDAYNDALLVALLSIRLRRRQRVQVPPRIANDAQLPH